MIDAPEFHDVKLKEYCTEANIDLKERTFVVFFATPFSGCGLLAPLSFFSKEELPADCEVILRTVEKPKEPKSNLAVIGVYGFNPTFFKVYPKRKPSWRNEMEITDAISLLIDSGFKVVPHHVEGWWKDTGKPEDILEANHLILDGIEAKNEGKVEEFPERCSRFR